MATDPAKRSGTALGRWLTQPPRVWHIAALGVICAITAYASSFPGGLRSLLFTGSIPWFLFATCAIWPGGFALLGIDYVAQAAVCASTRRFHAHDWRWYVAAVLIIATIAAWRTDRLLRWRFSRNRATLEATVVRLLKVPTSVPADGACGVQWPYAAFRPYGARVGNYQVRQVAVFPDERAVFLMTGGFFRSGWGFLYDLDGRADGAPMDLSALGNGWFTFTYARE